MSRGFTALVDILGGNGGKAVVQAGTEAAVFPQCAGEACHGSEKVFAFLQNLFPVAILHQKLQPQIIAHNGIGGMNIGIYCLPVPPWAELGSQK